MARNKTALLSTRIQLEGQAEWSRQLELAKQSVKELKSELALLDSENINNKNSVDYLRKANELNNAVLAQLNVQLENLQKEQQGYINQHKGYEKALEEATQGHKDLTDSLSGVIAMDEARITAVKREIEIVQQAKQAEKDRLESIKPQIRAWQTAIEDANKAIEENSKEIEKNNGKIKTAQEREASYAKAVDDYTNTTYKKRRDALAEVANKLDDYNIELKNGAITQEEYEKKVKALQPTIDKVNVAFEKSTRILDEKIAKDQAAKDRIAALEQANVTLTAEIDRQKDVIVENYNNIVNENKALEDLDRQEQDLVVDLNEATERYKENTAEIKKSEDKITALNIHLNDNEKNQQRVATQINNTRIEMNKYNGLIEQNQQYIQEATENEREYTALIDNKGKSLEKVIKKEEELAKKEKDDARRIAVSQLEKQYEKLYKFITECSNAAMQFETRLANVQKTTNMTDAEIAEFGNELQKLSERIPLSANGLADIAEKAGQLGIATKDLEGFVETMAMMGVATDLPAVEAAENLAQVASITGMTSDQYSRLSSSIVALGNNFATGERAIVQFTQRIAGAAANAGISEAEMVGLATAISSLGIRADAGGTALQSLIGKMESAVSTGNGLEEWARVCGVTTEELATLWRDDATSAIQLFVKGLGSLDESYVTVLRDLGIGEQRIIRTVSSLANAEKETNLLTRALEMSQTAWDENNALIAEASKRYDTTESKIQVYKNSLENIKVTIGEQLNPALGKLAEMGTSINKFVEWLVSNLPNLGTVLVGVAGAIAGLNFNLKGTVDSITGVVSALTSSITPTGLCIAAVTGLTAAIVAYNLALDTPVKQTKELTKSMKNNRTEAEKNVKTAEANADAINAQVKVITELIEAEDKTAGEKAIIANLVDELNESVPNLNLAYDKEKDTLYDVATNAQLSASQLRDMAKAQADSIIQQEKQEALTQMYVNRARIEEELRDVENDLLAVRERLSKKDYESRDEAVELTKKEKELTKQFELLTDELNDTTDAINEYSIGLEEASEVTEDTAPSAIETLKSAQKELQKEFDNTKKEAIAKFQVGLTDALDTVTKKTKMSADDIVDNLITTTTYYAEASANLSKLMSMNIDGLQEMLREMQKDGQLSVEVLGALAEATPDALEIIIGEYNKAKDAANAWGDSYAKLATDIENKTRKIKESLDSLKDKTVTVTTVYRSTNKDDPFSKGFYTYNAQGLDYVPYDDYAAMLHEGEMVLTRAEARAYRQEHTTGQSITNNTRNFGGVTLNVYSRQGQNIDELADEIMYRIEDATKRKEAVWA